jgi:hypothetical protein
MKYLKNTGAALAVFFAISTCAYAPIVKAWPPNFVPNLDLERIECFAKIIEKAQYFALLDNVLEEVGTNPDDWAPVFQERLKTLRMDELPLDEWHNLLNQKSKECEL